MWYGCKQNYLCDQDETGYGTGVIRIISVIRMKLGMV